MILGLQSVAKDGEVDLCEHMVDANNMLLQVKAQHHIGVEEGRYMWNILNFTYKPFICIHVRKRKEDNKWWYLA